MSSNREEKLRFVEENCVSLDFFNEFDRSVDSERIRSIRRYRFFPVRTRRDSRRTPTRKIRSRTDTMN